MLGPWRSRAVRLVLGGVGGGAAKLLGAWAGGFPVLGILSVTSLAFVSIAALFGWPGLLGMAAAHAAFAIARDSSLSYLLVSTAVYSLAGALVYETFRRTQGVGRGMPGFRSFLAYALAAGASALLTGTAISLIFEESWEQAALWVRSSLVTVVVFGPPLLIAGRRFLRRWLAPVPGEATARGRPRFALSSVERRGDLPGVVRRPEPSQATSLVVGAAMILAVAALTLVTGGAVLASTYWVGLLYLIPITWAARRHLLRGGLVATGAAGLAFLAVETLVAADLGPEALGLHELSCLAYLLVFVATGVMVGVGREREVDLLEHLYASNRRLRKDLQRVVRALSGAVEAKDLYTEGHLRRVSGAAVAVGRRLGLAEGDLEALRIASALHDIGKIGIPEDLLNKPAPLAAAEREVMARHPAIGARILETVEGLEAAAALVLHHQERWDGITEGTFPGYPAGLAGEEIPLGARIIAVVDAFDAMTTDRPYRRAVSAERAVAELRAEAGRQFDPAVVEAFLALLAERPWS